MNRTSHANAALVIALGSAPRQPHGAHMTALNSRPNSTASKTCWSLMPSSHAGHARRCAYCRCPGTGELTCTTLECASVGAASLPAPAALHPVTDTVCALCRPAPWKRGAAASAGPVAGIREHGGQGRQGSQARIWLKPQVEAYTMHVVTLLMCGQRPPVCIMNHTLATWQLTWFACSSASM